MIFDKAGKFYDSNFTYKQRKLESVRECKYMFLGVTFAICFTRIVQKRLKGFFKLKSNFGTSIPNVNVAFHIFDHTIIPMLTHCSGIWGSCVTELRKLNQTVDKLYKDKHADKLHLKFCKYILGVY